MILALIFRLVIVKPVYHGEDPCIAFQPMTVKKFLQNCTQRIRSSNHPLPHRMLKPVPTHMRSISERWEEVGTGTI